MSKEVSLTHPLHDLTVRPSVRVAMSSVGVPVAISVRVTILLLSVRMSV